MGKLFGTNGIRGIVNEDMNTDLALNIGKSWGTVLKRTINRHSTTIKHISKDNRSYMVLLVLVYLGFEVGEYVV